ncbi:MAG: hypothetical protein AAF530_09320 [Pseudomonadota bacterium]
MSNDRSLSGQPILWGPLSVAALALFLIFTPGWAMTDIRSISLQGLKLGASQSEVQSALPRMFFQNVPYEDPSVGLSYVPFYGKEAIAQITGSSQMVDGDRVTNVATNLTGDGQLYRIEVQEVDPNLTCASIFQDNLDLHGEPQLSQEPYLLEWLQRDFDFDQNYKVECFDGRRAIFILEDRRALERYLAKLRKELNTSIDQTLTRGGR